MLPYGGKRSHIGTSGKNRRPCFCCCCRAARRTAAMGRKKRARRDAKKDIKRRLEE